MPFLPNKPRGVPRVNDLAANYLAPKSLRPSGFGYALKSPCPRMRNKGMATTCFRPPAAGSSLAIRVRHRDDAYPADRDVRCAQERPQEELKGPCVLPWSRPVR